MKRTLLILFVAGVSFAAAGLIVSQRQTARHAAQLAELQAAWQTKQAELEAALERAAEEVRARLKELRSRRPDAALRWAMGIAMPSLVGRVAPDRLRARLEPVLAEVIR